MKIRENPPIVIYTVILFMWSPRGQAEMLLRCGKTTTSAKDSLQTALFVYTCEIILQQGLTNT